VLAAGAVKGGDTMTPSSRVTRATNLAVIE
jgi:hypothetical protein